MLDWPPPLMNAPDPITPETPLRRAAKLGWGVLIAATLYVCYFSHLGAIGFVGPDEPRYAWIARDMAESGDWVTPRLYGQPWFEKPVLYYWGGALSFKLFGVSEAAARLPSVVSALLATLALAWLAWRLYGAETARWLLLLLPTSVGMIGFSHAAAPDMPFSGMLTLAMVAAAVVLGLPRNPSDTSPQPTPWLALGAFGFFLGAAVLAKGPAAVILSGGVVFFWAVFTKRWRDAFRLFHPAALASFFATALPWYLLCARRNPGFFRVFIIEHNFKRYLTPEFRHVQPFWFYGPILLLAVLPWTAILIGLGKDAAFAWRENRWRTHSGLFFACWAAFPIAFFSLSQSKLPSYILPAVPPLLFLIAQHTAARTCKTHVGNRWMAIASGTTLVGLGLTAYLLLDKAPFAMEALSPISLGRAVGIIALGGLFTAILGMVRQPSAALCVSVCACITAIFLALTPGAQGSAPVRSTVQTLARNSPGFLPQRATTYKLHRSLHYSLNFYLHRELPEWSPDHPQPGWIFTSGIGSFELQRLNVYCQPALVTEAIAVCEDAGAKARNAIPDRQ